MLNRYAEHRESNLGSVPNSSRPLKGTGLLGDFSVIIIHITISRASIRAISPIPTGEQYTTHPTYYWSATSALRITITRAQRPPETRYSNSYTSDKNTHDESESRKPRQQTKSRPQAA